MEPQNLTHKNGRFRLSGAAGQLVPVEMYIDATLLPSNSCAERLVEIASFSSVFGRVVVLPDVFCKNKNFVPGGVAIATKGTIVPMFSGPSNDSLALFQTDLNISDITGDNWDRWFSEMQKRIEIYRRTASIISEEELWDIICASKKDFRESWADRVGNLDLLDEMTIEDYEALSPEEIVDVFPRSRPEMLPPFIPDHDVVTAGRKNLCVIDGNSHFIEMCAVEEIVNSEIVSHFNVQPGKVCIAIHAGSADVGLIAQKQFLQGGGRSEILVLDSVEERQYTTARKVSDRFGYANRLALIEAVLLSLSEVLGTDVKARLLSDAPHDFIEKIDEDGEPLVLHRKGAVRALPAGLYPEGHLYNQYGKPFFFPSSPGNDSYLMINTEGNHDSFYTCSHGAGRIMAMEEASVQFAKDEVLSLSKSRNVRLYSFGKGKLASQSPSAFKPMDLVMNTLQSMNLAQPVARLKPVAVIKT